MEQRKKLLSWLWETAQIEQELDAKQRALMSKFAEEFASEYSAAVDRIQNLPQLDGGTGTENENGANKSVAEVLEEDFKREKALMEEYCETHGLSAMKRDDFIAYQEWRVNKLVGKSNTNKSAEEIEEERIRKKTEEIMKECDLV
ncbi:MAG: hypothetical protein K2I47_07745 [Odoribacter sp.]|nr:hypothetical protein [Odoribacter sp.]